MKATASLCLAALLGPFGAARANGPAIPVGAARIDVTPAEPVHLINELGDDESAGVAQRLFARALAIGDDDAAVVLVSFDGIGVPAALAERAAARLKTSRGLERERFSLCATHTHWAPHLTGLLPTIWRGPLPPEQQEHADAYTRALEDGIVAAAERALDAREPCEVRLAEGRADFTANRRLTETGRLTVDDALMFTWNPDAPVDRRLPVLVASSVSEPEKVTAILFTVACHNVAITGREISGFKNRVHGDFAGLATEAVEARHPEAVALCTIGCGGDQRPTPCGGLAVARAHAEALADEVDALLAKDAGKPLRSAVTKAHRAETRLPLEPVPDRATLEKWAGDLASGSRGAVARGFLALALLERLDRGDAAEESIPFGATAWHFGDQCSMLFLDGEVTVDYADLIREKFGDYPRTWVTAYANAIPCYIVSRRQVEAGGYEPGNSMFYYGHLRSFTPEVEDRVMGAVAATFTASGE